MLGFLRARWDDYRIHRWLKYRRDNISLEGSLRYAYLDAETAARIIRSELVKNLARVGIVDTGSTDWMGQIRIFLPALADLAPALPKASQDEIDRVLARLRNHNWGFVRGAASLGQQIRLGQTQPSEAK